MTSVTIYKTADRPFRCTVAQAGVLDSLTALRKGGIGRITGYKPTTNVLKDGIQPVHDYQVITAFNLSRLYQRKVKALNALTFGDVAEDIARAPKLKALSSADALDLFNSAKKAAIDSCTKTLDGDREDAHRQGHDRCYIKVGDGVKVNLVTVKVDGLEQPVLTDGLPTVASILLPVLEISKTVVVEGEYKTVNSGAKVLMDNVIAKHLNQRSVGYKCLSLKADNFTALSVDKHTITPKDLEVSGNKAKLLSLLEACGFDGDALALIALMESGGAKL